MSCTEESDLLQDLVHLGIVWMDPSREVERVIAWVL